MSRTSTFAALAAIAVIGGGCAGTPNTNQLTPANNPSVYSVHQPVVERTDFVLDLATSGDSVPAAELERLEAWFDAIGLGYGNHVWIDEPGGYRLAGARSDVARAAGQYGLLIAEGAPVTAGEVPPGSIRVIASRSTAGVPTCPDWDSAGNGIVPPQNTSTNFGCALNSNLAAMVANPADLVLGQTGSSNGSGTTAGRAIRVYRDRQPTGSQPLPQTSTTGGQ